MNITKGSWLNKLGFTAGGFIIAILIIDLFSGSSETEPEKYKENFERNYGIYALDLPENIDFAGEKVPMEMDDARERLDRELLVNTYWQSNTLLFFKRANRWFPVIEPILKQNGIPEDFKYLTLVESGLQDVVSPSGATGYWQFMKSASKEYGLAVNSEVDERYHIEKATEAACKYFRKAYDEFNNWTLAAASFNMGVSGLRWHLAKQEVISFYDLNLNSETSRYIFRLLAIKEILENPDQYGFHFRSEHLYQPYRTRVILVDSTVDNLYHFAKANNITYKDLKKLNPWLRSTRLRVAAGKSYEIKVPVTMDNDRQVPVNIFYDEIPVQKIAEPVKKPEPRLVVYEVKKRDRIEDIAKKFDVDPELIIQWNKLENRKIRKGQSLKIYIGDK